ncbi:MAG: methyltransferase domain-containing protein [Victivallales bacterium]|nr:methyltransferase domain-containing protein [Victivallales bacterium]
MAHNETIRREFAKQAASFGDRGLTLSSHEHLTWMVGILPLASDFRVLDVATGTGHLSRAIAPHVRQVVAVDVTPEMLDKAKEEAVRSDLDNILFEEADAAALPYPDASFDMVVSRLAIHHFEKPGLQLGEMVRVCKPDHTVAIIDLLSPADKSMIESYNRLERLRDVSHTLALTEGQLVDAMASSGLSVQSVDKREIAVDFERWVEMTGTNFQTRDRIKAELQAELRGGAKTGMRPYMQEGTLKFLQTWCVAIGTRSSAKTAGKQRL